MIGQFNCSINNVDIFHKLSMIEISAIEDIVHRF